MRTIKNLKDICAATGMAVIILLYSGISFNTVCGQGMPIRNQLNRQVQYLYYPQSVKRFYAATNFKAAWVAPDTVKTHAYDAMLLLDCVRQYGLNHADYHPDKLLYKRLNAITANYAGTSEDEKAAFDIFLTDAMIRFINNLHYGKLNPRYSSKLLDARSNDGLRAEEILLKADDSKNFVADIERVQPRSELYRDLQRQMHQMAGVYVGDCYEVPEALLRQVAANMERLRWMPVRGRSYVQVNIPSFTLRFHQQDTDISYRVVVGKRETPTTVASGVLSGVVLGGPVPDIRRWLPPSLNDISYVEKHAYQLTDLDGKRIEPTAANIAMARQNPSKYRLIIPKPGQTAVNQINFELSGAPNIILAGRAEGRPFKTINPALSNGTIWIDQARKFTESLFKYDNGHNSIAELNKAIASKQHRNYHLKTQLPVYVTYQTCEVKEGVLETYDDIYHLDDRLVKALFKGAFTVPAYQ
ncbi:hypothetical protein [Mucilaginibacter sp. PPCGB 2223]|uniref:hypothetical protein n=1 Tax=Mucilaginibacter sp. PPCGB 2223 TaxID=1886027 RepID=UPI001111D586|nr:hypothetical protein [Mucilaginibacter sp. PPCGB 2223]